MNDSSKSSSSSPPSPIQSSFDDITQLLARKKNIIVLVGAGISVSCGIPDFRSNDGLYNTLNYQVCVMMLCSLELIFYIYNKCSKLLNCLTIFYMYRSLA